MLKNDQAESSEQYLEQSFRLNRQDDGDGDVEVQFESQRPRWGEISARIGPCEEDSEVESGAVARRQRDPGGPDKRCQQHQPIERKNSEGSSEGEIQRELR